MAEIRLGVDVRLLGPRHSGLGRYNEELLRALRSHCPEVEIVAFTDGSVASKKITQELGIETYALSYRPYGVTEQIRLPAMLTAARLDLVHFPHFTVPVGYFGPYVVTIHDLILHHYPSRTVSTIPAPFFWVKYVAYRYVVRRALARALRVIAVSQFTAEDLLTYYPWVQPRLVIVPESVSSFFIQPQPDKLDKLPYTVSRPYVLVVGNFYPHKNIACLLKAWAEVYAKTGRQLVMVGRIDEFAGRLQQLARQLFSDDEQSRAVRWVGYATDAELAVLYRDADYYLCPSLFEGVGLPGLEALAVGTPVLSSAATALPEVYGSAATYVPVNQPQRLAASLIQLLGGRRIAPARTPSRVQPAEVAKKLLRVYREAVAV